MQIIYFIITFLNFPLIFLHDSESLIKIQQKIIENLSGPIHKTFKVSTNDITEFFFQNISTNATFEKIQFYSYVNKFNVYDLTGIFYFDLVITHINPKKKLYPLTKKTLLSRKGLTGYIIFPNVQFSELEDHSFECNFVLATKNITLNFGDLEEYSVYFDIDKKSVEKGFEEMYKSFIQNSILLYPKSDIIILFEKVINYIDSKDYDFKKEKCKVNLNKIYYVDIKKENPTSMTFSSITLTFHISGSYLMNCEVKIEYISYSLGTQKFIFGKFFSPPHQIIETSIKHIFNKGLESLLKEEK